MDKLLEFLRRKRHWLLFVVMEVLALFVLFNTGLYHRVLGLTATNAVVGRVNTVMSQARSYMNLREENHRLMARIASLEGQYMQLQQQMSFAIADTVRPLVFVPDSTCLESPKLSFVTARVISATDHSLDNHLVIDKGRAHGILPDMTVMSDRGVVGVVASVSNYYAVVITLIHPKLKLSCRIKGSNYVGSLSWEDPADESNAFLSDLPNHAEVKEGDTVLTSGYSYTFVPNLMVGRVSSLKARSSNRDRGHNINLTGQSAFSTVSVKFATDFSRLRFVYVLRSTPVREAQALEDSMMIRNGR